MHRESEGKLEKMRRYEGIIIKNLAQLGKINTSMELCTMVEQCL